MHYHPPNPQNISIPDFQCCLGQPAWLATTLLHFLPKEIRCIITTYCLLYFQLCVCVYVQIYTYRFEGGGRRGRKNTYIHTHIPYVNRHLTMNQGGFPMVNVNAYDHAFTYIESRVKATSQQQTRHRRLTVSVSSITKFISILNPTPSPCPKIFSLQFLTTAQIIPWWLGKIMPW